MNSTSIQRSRSSIFFNPFLQNVLENNKKRRDLTHLVDSVQREDGRGHQIHIYFPHPQRLKPHLHQTLLAHVPLQCLTILFPKFSP